MDTRPTERFSRSGGEHYNTALVAQWIEYLASNQRVGGSIPSERTVNKVSEQLSE